MSESGVFVSSRASWTNKHLYGHSALLGYSGGPWHGFVSSTNAHLFIMPIVHAQVQVWREQKKKTVVSWLWFGCLRTTNKRGRWRMIIMMTIMDVESMMCLMDPVLPFFFFFWLRKCRPAKLCPHHRSLRFCCLYAQPKTKKALVGEHRQQLFILGRDRREP